MKTILSVALSLVVLMASCSSNKANQDNSTPSDVDMKSIANYFAKNDWTPENPENLFILKDLPSFEERFGMARTMDNEIEIPDFTKQNVVAVLLQSTDKSTELSFDKASLDGEVLNVYLNKTEGEQQTYSIVPLLLLEVDKKVEPAQVVLNINGDKKVEVDF